MRVAWKAYRHRFQANEFGYAQANAGYQQALRLAGIEVVEVGDDMDLDTDPEIVLHWSVPELYAPFPGKVNVYGTVTESLTVRPAFRACFAHPLTAAVFTPSRFCQQIFRRVTQKPVFVCGHGVDGETFGYVHREWSPFDPRQRPFVFLFVGSSNPRKGSDFLLEWWNSRDWQHEWVSRHCPPVRLYFKVSDIDFDKATVELRRLRARPTRQEYGGFVYHEGTLTLDTRLLPAPALSAIYQFAHCFVFPSRGEGFGLTVAEALATGLPCIATRFGGYLDFCDDTTAFLCDFTPTPLLGTNGGTFVGAKPDPGDFSRHVHAVLEDYPSAVGRGTRAAARLRQDVTWRQVGWQFMDMLAAVHGQRLLDQQGVPPHG